MGNGGRRNMLHHIYAPVETPTASIGAGNTKAGHQGFKDYRKPPNLLYRPRRVNSGTVFAASPRTIVAGP